MNALLKFNNISRQFSRTSARVLDQVSVTIRQGDFVMLTGPSGSGKSTFLHISALLDRADSGELMFDGEGVTQLSDKALSRIRATRFGMVFQAYHLLQGRTVLDNVLFRFRYLPDTYRDSLQKSKSALAKVGLQHLHNKPVRFLSGGEMQRVALARAIAATPDILFADEPTGNLDRATSLTIMQHLKMLNQQGLTIVMVTHDESLLSFANRCFQVNNAHLTQRVA